METCASGDFSTSHLVPPLEGSIIPTLPQWRQILILETLWILLNCVQNTELFHKAMFSFPIYCLAHSPSNEFGNDSSTKGRGTEHTQLSVPGTENWAFLELEPRLPGLGQFRCIWLPCLYKFITCRGRLSNADKSCGYFFPADFSPGVCQPNRACVTGLTGVKPCV